MRARRGNGDARDFKSSTPIAHTMQQRRNTCAAHLRSSSRRIPGAAKANSARTVCWRSRRAARGAKPSGIAEKGRTPNHALGP